jgi:predicted TIM-barrel fold metal-dependent hydrolase
VDIFVATMLDFDKWVYEGSPVSLSQQADLMTLLAIASDGRVLPFIPFDPWRDVAHRGGVLAWVRAAIESGAAVGVKLYPPMGFRASHNDQSFEDWRAGLDQDHLGADFGQRVDASLDALFAWSAANGVPILAHTGASNYSRLSAKNDAEPTYWEEVLGKYPTLRLNLSHLGGQEAETAPWRDEVVRLFQRPNVYADVACFDPRPDASGGFWPKLKAQVDANPLIGRRLLYGSDWFLLSDCAVPASYENTMRTTVGDMLGSAVSVGVFGDNAIDYLGLRRGQPARTRLDGFYGLYQVDARWRAVVDRH